MSQKKRHSYQLSVYRRIRAACWEDESNEVKTEIQNLFDEQRGVKDEEDNVDGNESEGKEEVDNGNDSDNDDNEEKTLLRQQQE